MKITLFPFLVIFMSLNVVNVRGEGYIMPASCMGQTYCTEKGDDYPDDNDFLNALYNSDLLQKNNEIEVRLGERGEMSCKGEYKNATIYYIVDTKQTVQAVIQLDNYFTQKHELRYCKYEGDKNCTERSLKSLGVTPICKNQTMLSDFLIINSMMHVELVQAMIPVCCNCIYE